MFKEIVLLIAIFIIAGSCNAKKKESLEDSISQTDTNCKNEIERAKSDLKNNKLVFCHYVGNIMLMSLRGEKEMDSLLKLSNIGYANESSPCVVQKNRHYHCYCDIMQERIVQKYGQRFTDSLLYIADKIYVLKHPDQVFDDWDRPPVFPGDSTYDETNHSGLQYEFDKLVRYPKGYKFRAGDTARAMLELHLLIDESGKAKIVDGDFIYWDNKYVDIDDNKKFNSYFRNVASSLIEKTRWTPAKIKSICVKSKSDIFLYLK